MNRATALAILLALAALTAAALVAPWPVPAALAVVSLAIAPRRVALFAFAATSIAINATILWLVANDPLQGVVGGARMTAALGVNLAVVGRVGTARLLDAVRLPARATTLVAAVLLAAQDVGRDLSRLVDARRAEGEWPRGRLARVRAAARLAPALLFAAERRAAARRDALRLAGHGAPSWFVPVVAVAALAAAGRLAFLALPNVALTFVVAFLGGMLYGWRVGAAGGALGMLVTDLMLSGLHPLGLVNAPAMALLGVAGAALRRVDLVGGSRADRAAALVFAFTIGVVGTIAFSVASDSLTWLVVAPGAPRAWVAIVLAGLAFNVVPAAVNGLLFALTVRPVLVAWRARRGAQRASRGPASRDAAAPPAPGPATPPAAPPAS